MTHRPLRQSRLVVSVAIPFSLFVIFVIILVSAWMSIELIRERTSLVSFVDINTRTLSEELGYYFGYLARDLRVVARVLGSSVVEEKSSASLVKNVLRENSSILEMVVYDLEGDILIRSVNPTVGDVIAKNAEESESYAVQALIEKREMLTPPVQSIYNTSVAYWFFPVQNTFGEARGMLRATIDLSVLWNVVSRRDTSSQSHVYVVDNTGALIVANTPSLKTTANISKISAVNAFLEGRSGVVTYQGISGHEVVGTWYPIQETGWGIVLEIPMSIGLERQIQTATILGGIIGSLILLILYELYIIRKNLSEPLQNITQGLVELSKGNYATRITISVSNEFRAIADVLNTLAENVERSTSNIVERLQKLLVEQEKSAKLLIRRDLELNEANEKLRSLDESKSKFVSVAAHQLRTPLSAIRWALQILFDGDYGSLTPEQRAIVFKASESTTRMVRLVNDLLDVDHIETGQFEYRFTPIAIPEVIESIIAELSAVALGHNISVTFANPDPEFPTITADAEKIRSVFQNLLENAIKYTMKGGKVTISVFDRGDYIESEITDTGIGIPKKQQQFIFQKFFRTQNAQKVETDGSGLGLFIVKEIIDRHGGEISFTSEENKGTTFYVKIPKTPNKRFITP